MSCAALLCGLYLKGAIAVLRQPSAHRVQGEVWMYDRNIVRNPYGVAEIGYAHAFGARVVASFALRHESSMPLGDRGDDSAQLSLTFYPWGRP